MTGDMAVVLGSATVNGATLFAHNGSRPVAARHRIVLEPGRTSYDNAVQFGAIKVPPARQTWTVLGLQLEDGWGYLHGVNEHGVVAGVTSWDTAVESTAPGLTGTDLVRLALERAHSARQAV